MNSSEYPSREFAAEKVLLLWFGRHVLFEELRKHHGAYGCTAGICNNTNTIRIDSARDPDPNKALSIVEKCLAQLSELGECKAITEDFVKDQILKTLSKELGDIRPYIKGRSSFESRLNGLSPNLRKTLIKHIHELTLQNFIEAGKRIAEKSKNLKACIITGDEGQACGEVICNFRKINDETK